MAAQFNPSYLENLPDSFLKTQDSVNAKILQIEQDALATLKTADEDNPGEIEQLCRILDFTNATGKTLDLYGEMFSQPRNGASDDGYRYLLRSRVARNMSSGSLESVMDAVQATFQCGPGEFKLKDGDAPASVYITDLPLDILTGASLSFGQFSTLFKELMPVGITVYATGLGGTFELGATYLTGSTTGFADRDGTTKEDGDDAGYLGLFFSNEKEPMDNLKL